MHRLYSQRLTGLWLWKYGPVYKDNKASEL